MIAEIFYSWVDETSLCVLTTLPYTDGVPGEPTADIVDS